MESSGGYLYRIKKCTFNLLPMEDDLAFDNAKTEDEVESLWEFIDRNLCLRSTYMYCDLSSVISGTYDEQAKQSLIHLGNQFFQLVEELRNAIEIRSNSKSQSCYHELMDALRELLTALLPPSQPSVHSVLETEWVFDLKESSPSHSQQSAQTPSLTLSSPFSFLLTLSSLLAQSPSHSQ